MSRVCVKKRFRYLSQSYGGVVEAEVARYPYSRVQAQDDDDC